MPKISYDSRIIIEAGTPFIKREGANGIRTIRRYWPGIVVADLKITDGAIDEVFFASAAGASAATAMGSAPKETLDRFIEACAVKGMYSIIDMLGVTNPLKFLMPLKQKPDMVV
ncbi:MAG: orotidine 5'-phosphate decarboxylase / HUMPS family protein, partial [Promethearchaeota archaeon]